MIPSERDIKKLIRSDRLALPPLSFEILKEKQREKNGIQADYILEGKWGTKRYKFVAEIKRYSSDKVLMNSARQALFFSKALNLSPLVIVPWLSNEQLKELENLGVSGIDLCGNGIITVPPELFVLRSGSPNKYRASRLIKRVYRGVSSLVARVFLMRPKFNSVSEILDEIIQREGKTTLPTVSKALSQLEEDLVVDRSDGQIKLLQADKLLDRLAGDYKGPAAEVRMKCKVETRSKDLRSLIFKAAKKADARMVMTGISSAPFYSVIAKEPIDSFYCSSAPLKELEALGAKVDGNSRFPNVEFIETDDELVYFDARKESNCMIASPVQSYLELWNSDKRARETAEQVRPKLLTGIDDYKGAKR